MRVTNHYTVANEPARESDEANDRPSSDSKTYINVDLWSPLRSMYIMQQLVPEQRVERLLERLLELPLKDHYCCYYYC